MAMAAKEIVHSVGMQDVPEYYSHHNVNFGDINADLLYRIYVLIQNNIGEMQADSYVTMIQQLKILSAQNFLHCLYTLEKNAWNDNTKYDSVLVYTSQDLLLSEDIRRLFLRKIGYKKNYA